MILLVSIALWCLASVPTNNGQPPAIENSIIGQIGKSIEPAIEPLGFNWKIGIGLITSLAAREVIVGTLGTLYGMEGTSQSTELQAALRKILAARRISLLIFFAFAMQCFSTIAVVRRETGRWTWPAVQFIYMTALAYFGSLIAYQVLTRWTF